MTLTKDKIYLAAKKLFLKQGYKKTTIQQIADAADVPKGLVTYYFKKEDFITQIYVDYTSSIYRCIERQTSIENIFQKNLIMLRIFYNIIFSDENYKKFYREILFDNLLPMESPVHARIRKPILKFIEEVNPNVSEEFFSLVLEAEYGARHSLMQLKYDTLSPQKADDFMYFIATISARLAEFPAQTIKENVRKADLLYKKIDYKNIFFVDMSE